jgi:pre-mRNA-splicing factor RBM22/SLT11
MDPSQIRSIVHVAKTRFVSHSLFRTILSEHFTSRCAFVNFKDRESAERAAEAWANGLDLDGERVDVRWGRSRPAKPPNNLISPPVVATQPSDP